MRKPGSKEIEQALEENVKRGYMVKNPDGTYSLTPLGIEHLESLRKPEYKPFWKKPRAQ